MASKKFFLLFLFCGFIQSVNAQFIKMGGISVQTVSKNYLQNGDFITDPCDELYNVSFKDSILVHNIFTEGSLTVSQVYQINHIAKAGDDEVAIFSFEALSGRSGMTYKYSIKVDAEGKLISLICNEPDGSKVTYKGDVIELKTFKQ